MFEVVIITVYLTVANAEELALRRRGTKEIKVVDPFESRTNI